MGWFVACCEAVRGGRVVMYSGCVTGRLRARLKLPWLIVEGEGMQWQ